MPSNQQTRKFQIRAEAVDASHRAITATVATDAPVEIFDWASGRIVREILLMDGVEISPHVPLLCDHDRSIASMVGDAVNIHVERNELVAMLRFAAGTPAADHAWELYGRRLGRQLSIGYSVLECEEIPAGRSCVIRGKQFTAPAAQPLRVTTRWRVREVSLTPIGADSGAMTRRFSSIQTERNAKVKSSVFEVVGNEVRSMRFPQFFAAGMSRRGEAVPQDDHAIVRAALSSVGGVDDLVAAINATILGGFRAAPDSTAGWVRTISLPNFLLSELAAVSIEPRLGKISNGVVAPTVNFALGSQGWRLARFGCQFAIDEMDLLNGNAIGVYQTALVVVGQAARRLIPDLVYATLLANPQRTDGKATFHADRGNFATDALADTALDTGLAAIGNQISVDEVGDPIHRGLAAGFLVVPPSLLGKARRLVNAMQTGEGDLLVRSDSRLGAAGVVDPRSDAVVKGSAANWLLTCPSDQAAGVVVGVRDGLAEPSIRHYKLTNGQWGMGFDIVFDLACTIADPTGVYFSTGAVSQS